MNTISTCRAHLRAHWIGGAPTCLLAGSGAVALEYSQRQTLRASTLGEGQPHLGHGARVAVDGALAVVADDPDFRTSTTVRTYVRTGRNRALSSAPDIRVTERPNDQPPVDLSTVMASTRPTTIIGARCCPPSATRSMTGRRLVDHFVFDVADTVD